MEEEPDFNPSLYVERDVDRALWQRLSQCIQANQKSFWLSLESGSGHGNTSLLRRIQFLTANSSAFSLGVRVLLIRSGESDSESLPNDLSPLANELFQNLSQGRLSTWRRLKLRLHHASTWQLAKGLLLLMGGLMVSSMIVGFHQYMTSVNARLIDIIHWFPEFWTLYLPLHWPNFFIWFITGSIAGLPFSMGVLYMVRNRILPGTASVTPAEEDFSFLRSERGLIYSLEEFCNGYRSVLLLVDDAYSLPKFEKQFLFKLFNTPGYERDILRFRKTHNVIIVSVEKQQDAWQQSLPQEMQKSLETLAVPDFSLLELRDIARAQLPPANGHAGLPEDELENLLEQAQQHTNVKLLFAHRYENLVGQMGDEFLKAQEKDIEGVFRLEEMMAYRAVQSTSFMSEKDLLSWLRSLASSEYLATFGLESPDGVQQLMKDFLKATSMVRKSGRICYFDSIRCRALQKWLRQHSPTLLAQAHYYWFWSSFKLVPDIGHTPGGVTALSLPLQQGVKRGAWHAAKIGYLFDKPISLFQNATGLTDAQKLEWCYHVAAVLLSSAAIWRSEGNLDEADELIVDAEEWLGSPNGEEGDSWLESAAEQLWQDYWLAADRSTRQQLNALATQFPHVCEKPGWILNQRLEELLHGVEVLKPLPVEPPESNARQCNLHRLVETMLEIRNSHGFVKAALRDPQFQIREPLPAPDDPLPEFFLLHLKAMALNERGEFEFLKEALAGWRLRLEKTEPASGHVGAEALHAFNEARYWHMLADIWLRRIDEIDKLSSEEKEAALEDLQQYFISACLRSPDNTTKIHKFVSSEAQYAYERALQVAAILNWRPIVLEVSFHLRYFTAGPHLDGSTGRRQKLVDTLGQGIQPLHQA